MTETVMPFLRSVSSHPTRRAWPLDIPSMFLIRRWKSLARLRPARAFPSIAMVLPLRQRKWIGSIRLPLQLRKKAIMLKRNRKFDSRTTRRVFNQVHLPIPYLSFPHVSTFFSPFGKSQTVLDYAIVGCVVAHALHQSAWFIWFVHTKIAPQLLHHSRPTCMCLQVGIILGRHAWCHRYYITAERHN